MIDGNLCYGKV